MSISNKLVSIRFRDLEIGVAQDYYFYAYESYYRNGTYICSCKWLGSKDFCLEKFGFLLEDSLYKINDSHNLRYRIGGIY